ncbi:hypothetical protein RB213_014292 [Colletotrichum asianum]
MSQPEGQRVEPPMSCQVVSLLLGQLGGDKVWAAIPISGHPLCCVQRIQGKVPTQGQRIA